MAGKKKKAVASNLTDFEKLAGVVLLAVYLIVLPLWGGWLTDQLGVLLGVSISRAVSNIICFYLLFAAVVLVFHAFLYQTTQRFLSAMERCFRTLGLALVLFYGLNELIFRVSALLWGNLTNLNDAALVAQVAAAPGMMIFVVVFLSPFIEETLFRGLIFGWLRQHSRAVAYAVSCLLFALLHVWQYALLQANPMYLLLVVQYIAPGLVFTWAYDHSGSLWTPIAAHAAVNALAVWAVLA